MGTLAVIGYDGLDLQSSRIHHDVWEFSRKGCGVLQAFGGGNRAQDEALSYQRSRCWHAVQSMRSLSDLCTASYTEDRLGTAQLAQPNIGQPLMLSQFRIS